MCKENGITGYSSLKKQEIIDILQHYEIKKQEKENEYIKRGNIKQTYLNEIMDNNMYLKQNEKNNLINSFTAVLNQLQKTIPKDKNELYVRIVI